MLEISILDMSLQMAKIASIFPTGQWVKTLWYPCHQAVVTSAIFASVIWSMETNRACHPGLIFNTLRPRQNGQNFPDDIFKCVFFNQNVWILIKISMKFVPKCPINNILALVQIMAWRCPGDKPLSEPMMVSLPKHLCITLANIFQTTVSNALSSMKMFEFWLRFQWSLFPMLSHYLNQWWLVYKSIYASLCLNESSQLPATDFKLEHLMISNCAVVSCAKKWCDLTAIHHQLLNYTNAKCLKSTLNSKQKILSEMDSNIICRWCHDFFSDKQRSKEARFSPIYY